MISNLVWNEIGNCPLGSNQLSFILLSEFCVGGHGGLGISVCMRETGAKWVLLPVSTSIASQGKDGGRSLGVLVPLRNGEMDCERKECRASFMLWFLNLFIYFPPTWSKMPAKFVHLCSCWSVWSLKAVQSDDACLLNLNTYSIAYVCAGAAALFWWDWDWSGTHLREGARASTCYLLLFIDDPFDFLFFLFSHMFFFFLLRGLFPHCICSILHFMQKKIKVWKVF